MQNDLLTLTDCHSILLIGFQNMDDLRRLFGVGVADFQLISEPTIKIEKIREIIHWINLRPMQGNIKLILIENADAMTTEAANSLLKTLEEPPSYAHIILQTLNEQKILPTIQSRCRKIRFNSVSNQEKPEIYLEPAEISQMRIKNKFEYAAKLADEESMVIKQVLTFWQDYYREKLLSGNDEISLLKNLARAKDLLETNISVKLLLENLVLKF